MAEILPVFEELHGFVDTDMEWDFVVEDKDGNRLDPLAELWTADFEIADSVTKVPKLNNPATPTADPDVPSASVLRVVIPDTEVQPGSGLTNWSIPTEGVKEFVYSLKRTNDTKEKILRYGPFHMHRARRSIP